MASNDLNTNPLYNNIAGAAQDVKAAYTGLPTFQSNMQASLVGPDAGLNSALGGYTDKVAELFAHDQQIAQNWSTSQVPSTIQPEGFMEDPYAKAMASSALYAQKGKETAGALNLYETRKNYLGDLVDKSVEIYKSIAEGKKLDLENARDLRDTAIDLMNAETSRMNANNSASQLGVTAQKLADAKTNAISDIQDWGTLDDVMNRYANSLSESDIVSLYESNSPYGKKLKESSDQIHRKYLAAKIGGDSRDILSTLQVSQQKPIIEASKSLVAGSDILTAIKTDLGDKAPTFFNAIANKNYGLARKILQPYLSTGQTGALIDATQAGLRQQIYGSAFTETEAKLAKLWLSQSTDQANQIWVKLLGQQQYGENQIRTAFKARHISEQEINDYLSYIGYSPTNTSNTSSDGRPSLSDFDK